MVVAISLLAGCSGESQEGNDELTAPTEHTAIVEETTAPPTAAKAPPQFKEKAAAAEVQQKAVEQGPNATPPGEFSARDKANVARGKCQLEKAAVDLGPEAFDALQNEFIAQFEESFRSGTDVQSIQEFLAERGYEC